MESFTITVRGESYPVTVGINLQSTLLEAIAKLNPARIAIITDSDVQQLWGKDVLAIVQQSGKPVELFSFPSGEKNKNQATVTSLQHALLEKRYGRDTLIIALGGGVVGDVAGFVASTLLRGVPYLQMPTTTLAMVDSSIGGKVGIDTVYGKNTVGAFYQPRAVLADLRFIKTQKKDHVINGLLEAIKTFLTSDKDALMLVGKLDLDEPLKDPKILQEIIMRSVRIKGGITERDETEQGERMIVNFGHTIGHAVEMLSKFELSHGYCVGYGILAETKVAERMGVLTPEDRSYVARYLEKFGITPEPLKQFSIADIIEATKSDKKTRAGVPHYVLLNGIGSILVKDGQYAHPVEDTLVQQALEALR